MTQRFSALGPVATIYIPGRVVHFHFLGGCAFEECMGSCAAWVTCYSTVVSLLHNVKAQIVFRRGHEAAVV